MSTSRNVPCDDKLDSSLDLAREGYLFIKNRTDKFGSDLFKTRLLLQDVICMSGEKAAEIFYNSDLFQRCDAAPKHVQKTLFGMNGIQSMDGKAHRERKQLFLKLTDLNCQKKLAELVAEQWQSSVSNFAVRDKIVLFNEAAVVLCKAVCGFAGVPLKASEASQRACDFSEMVDAFGAVGLRYQKGKMARLRTEKWIRGIVRDVRSGKLIPKQGTALYEIAFYRGPDGKMLDDQIAAVELINILRPVVAIATYIVFTALALYEHPEYKEKLQSENDYMMFVEEVRRLYPFTPFLGARVRRNFFWRHCPFEKGRLVLLDVYGMNHDYRIWDKPYKFMPERFYERNGGLFDFIPQGGGSLSTGHRCPGEGITIEVMKVSLDFLVNKIEYDVPDQDLYYSLSRIPTLPESKFVMCNIRKKEI